MTEIPRTKFTEHQFTAYLGHYLTFPSYLGSYKKAFDILISSIQESGSHIDTIAYPILFLARHCLELGLKTNIRYFAKYSSKIDYTNGGGHNLENLFEGFKLHVSETIKNLKLTHGIEVDNADVKSFDDLCLEVEKLKDSFHVLDQSSDAFRYPVDKKRNPSFEHGEKINLLDVNEILEKSMLLFVHTADVFAKYTDYANQIEAFYGDLMREQFQ